MFSLVIFIMLFFQSHDLIQSGIKIGFLLGRVFFVIAYIKIEYTVNLYIVSSTIY